MPSEPIIAANDTSEEVKVVPPACYAIARLLARAVVRDLANAIPENSAAKPRKDQTK